ncbi:hypothetical protein JAO85_02015 [Comamonas sp. NyZ500]|uniref:hypothetical protein n=1 Tax=Comamonas sp. NyZ500 TaxID=2795732 RepID=UPI00192B23CD|nr:hypothetical protein [Comamonas sp. NyZ500]MBL5976033.1 hypothetical protein [Comamonas sp. NyZ500]
MPFALHFVEVARLMAACCRVKNFCVPFMPASGANFAQTARALARRFVRLDVDSDVLTWLALLKGASMLEASTARQSNRRGIGGFRAQTGSLQAPNIFLKNRL